MSHENVIYSPHISSVFISYQDDALEEPLNSLVEDILQTDVFNTEQFFEDRNLYAALFRVFAKGMLPNSVFKLLLDQGHFKFDEMYTAHIEAFLFCVLESNFPRWKSENLMKYAKLPEGQTAANIKSIVLTDDQMRNLPLPRYTQQRDQNNNLKSGWTREGIEAFNGYVSKILAFRGGPLFPNFAEWTMSDYDRAMNPRARQRRRIARDEVALQQEAIAMDIAFEAAWQHNNFNA